MCRKMGKMNPLIISPISTCQFKVFNKESFFASLVTNIEDSIETIKSNYCDEPGPSSASAEKSSKGETYSEIDSIIKEIIAPSGKIGGWTFHQPSETFCYSIENYNYCKNVDRSHSNSKIYFLYCSKNHSLWQQCFSPKCRNFKSDPIPLPDYSWLDMEPWTQTE